MSNIKKTYYLFPLLLFILLLISNLVSAKMLAASSHHFTIWFIFLLASFVVGWLTNSGFKWSGGVRVISIVTLVSVVVSLALVVLFRKNLELNNSVLDNLIHYSLRLLTLGSFAVFGLTVSEVLKHKNEFNSDEDSENESTEPSTLKGETEYYIKEAKLKAEKIIFEANKEAAKIEEQKARVETQLRELIQTEREVIRSYEADENISDEKNVE